MSNFPETAEEFYLRTKEGGVGAEGFSRETTYTSPEIPPGISHLGEIRMEGEMSTFGWSTEVSKAGRKKLEEIKKLVSLK